MLINELSKRSGVSIHTLRYYENLGLIQGTTNENVKTNNYKDYDEHAVERLEIIVEAKEVGFTLAEIRTIIDGWFNASQPKEDLQILFQKKIAEMDRKIKQFRQMKKRLQEVCAELGNGTC